MIKLKKAQFFTLTDTSSVPRGPDNRYLRDLGSELVSPANDAHTCTHRSNRNTIFQMVNFEVKLIASTIGPCVFD